MLKVYGTLKNFGCVFLRQGSLTLHVKDLLFWLQFLHFLLNYMQARPISESIYNGVLNNKMFTVNSVFHNRCLLQGLVYWILHSPNVMFTFMYSWYILWVWEQVLNRWGIISYFLLVQVCQQDHAATPKKYCAGKETGSIFQGDLKAGSLSMKFECIGGDSQHTKR